MTLVCMHSACNVHFLTLSFCYGWQHAFSLLDLGANLWAPRSSLQLHTMQPPHVCVQVGQSSAAFTPRFGDITVGFPPLTTGHKCSLSCRWLEWGPDLQHACKNWTCSSASSVDIKSLHFFFLGNTTRRRSPCLIWNCWRQLDLSKGNKCLKIFFRIINCPLWAAVKDTIQPYSKVRLVGCVVFFFFFRQLDNSWYCIYISLTDSIFLSF